MRMVVLDARGLIGTKVVTAIRERRHETSRHPPCCFPEEQPMLGSMFPPVDESPSTPFSGSRVPRASAETADQKAKANAAMDFTLDASLENVQAINAAAAVLAEWYASHSVVRRLWAIEMVEAIRVVVMLEPTVDGDDTQPTWLAHSRSWVQELRSRMHRMVHLEMINEPLQIESSFDRSSALVTEVSWRDRSISAH